MYTAINAIPDRQITHEDIISNRDKVLIRRSMTGSPKQYLFTCQTQLVTLLRIYKILLCNY